MPFVQAGDIRIYYEIKGEGVPVLSISHTGGDLRLPPNIFGSPLAKHFEVLGYDQRGLGQSDKPDAPYTMAGYADDAANLLDALGWERCHVLGISFGGMVAQEFALRHPGRTDKLVLICTSPGGAGGASYPLHTLASLSSEERAEAYITLADTRRDSAWQAEHREDTARFAAFIKANQERFADEPDCAEGRARQLEARIHHDTFDRLNTITAPTFIAGGRYDGIATPGNQHAMAEKIPDSTLEFFEGGHLFFVEDKSAFPRIIEWLAE